VCIGMQFGNEVPLLQWIGWMCKYYTNVEEKLYALSKTLYSGMFKLVLRGH